MNTSIDVLLEHKGSFVRSVSVSAMVIDAVREMNRYKVGAILVMDGDEIVGIFTERDVMTRVVAMELNPKVTPVAQVMSRKVLTIPPGTTVDEVMELFVEKRCRHLPVVENGTLKGLISIGDISRHMSNVQRHECEQLKQYIAGGYPS